jgi:hypothetical protein
MEESALISLGNTKLVRFAKWHGWIGDKPAMSAVLPVHEIGFVPPKSRDGMDDVSGLEFHHP